MIHIYPAAVQRPGPAGKVWPDVNTVAGVICHSMQGNYDPGALSVLDDESLTDNHYRAASWHFSILRDGTVIQHYALNASPFHAGNHAANARLIGIEHEGGPPDNLSEPLTAQQTVASVALVRWIAQQAGWAMARHITLLEHNETTSTVCPSGRIPWKWYYPEEDEMDVTKLTGSEGIDAFMRAVTQLSPALGQQDGRYVGTVDAGDYIDVVIRVRKAD